MFEFDGYIFDRCPNFYRDTVFLSWAFRAYNWAEKGMLLMPGGYGQQPNKFVEACEYIGYLQAKKIKMNTQGK